MIKYWISTQIQKQIHKYISNELEDLGFDHHWYQIKLINWILLNESFRTSQENEKKKPKLSQVVLSLINLHHFNIYATFLWWSSSLIITTHTSPLSFIHNFKWRYRFYQCKLNSKWVDGVNTLWNLCKVL